MEDKKLLSFKDVLARYSFKPWGLRHRIRMRTIPFVKLYRSIYFDPKDLDKWIEEHKIKPVEMGGKKNETK